MRITRADQRTTGSGPEAYFSGRVRLTPMIETPEPARLRGLSVTFEAGARTAWHTHPLGQALIVTAGVGLAQVEGKRAVALRPGDVVWFEPGEKHWHGAGPRGDMTHIALQEALDGETATWMEHVSDEAYCDACDQAERQE